MTTVENLQPMPTPYETNEGDVLLSVVVGEGHRGRIVVSLDGTELERDATIDQLKVGEGPELVGKTLQVLTTVSATNPNSSLSIVTYTLEGGTAERSFPSHGPNVQPNDRVNFHAKFLFE